MTSEDTSRNGIFSSEDKQAIFENIKLQTGLSDGDIDRIVGTIDQDKTRHSGFSETDVKRMTIDALTEKKEENIQNFNDVKTSLGLDNQDMVKLLENSDYVVDEVLTQLSIEYNNTNIRLIQAIAGREEAIDLLRGSEEDIAITAKLARDKLMYKLDVAVGEHEPNIEEINQKTDDFAERIATQTSYKIEGSHELSDTDTSRTDYLEPRVEDEGFPETGSEERDQIKNEVSSFLERIKKEPGNRSR